MSGTLTSAAFWERVDRLEIPDEIALTLIDYPGKLPKSGKRPRFRLTTLQSRQADYLREIAGALETTGKSAEWLRRANRTQPFAGKSPLRYLQQHGPEGLAEVLRVLSRDSLRAALREAAKA